MGKGQVTVFILLGLVVLLVIAAVFVIRYTVTSKQVEVPRGEYLEEDVRPLQTFVDECLKQTSWDAAYYVGSRGGFTYLPESYLETNYSNIAYSFYSDNITFLSLTSMENQISEFVRINIFYCFNNFDSFEGQDIEYNLSNIDVDTTINNYDMDVILNFNIKARDTTINQFSTVLPIALGKVHEFVYTIAEKTKQQPEWIDLSYLASLSLEGFNATVMPEDENNLVYSIQKDDFTFLTAVYLEHDRIPVMEMPNNFTLQKGVSWFYDIEYFADTEVTFSDDSFLFDITKAGTIGFMPEIPGVYDVTIRIQDEKGSFSEKQIIFTIINGGP